LCTMLPSLLRSAGRLAGRCLHTTPPRPVPPWLMVLAKPAGRVLAALVGRTARVWWRRLPADKRALLVSRHRAKLGSAGLLLAGGLGYAYESHIQICPVTGRRRFVAMYPDQTKRISRQEFTNLLEEYQKDIVPAGHPLYSRVVAVSNRLLLGNRDMRQIYDKEWTVTVVNTDEKNAFVLPGGNIFVFKGMIDLCDNDDQLAVVLGHEMAHAVLGHVPEKLTLASFVQMVLLVPMAFLWALLPNDGIAFVADWFVQKVSKLFIDLPYSRLLEAEADEVGLQLTAKSCFDVREAPALWGLLELMSDSPLETDRDLEFLSSHPTHGARQESLASQLHRALEIRSQCGCARLDGRRDPQKALKAFKMALLKTSQGLEGKLEE